MEMKDLKILAFDTSGKNASVAVSDGERLLWEQTVYTKLTHSQVILPMVSRALEDTGLAYTDLDCVAVANGPGSYTGLRIGIGAVKGLCMGCEGLGCAGVSTLLSLAYNCLPFEGNIAAVMRARPKIVYFGLFRAHNGRIERLLDDKVCGEEEAFLGIDTDTPLMLAGDCAADIKQSWFAENENVRTAPFKDILQRAASLCAAVEEHPELITASDKLTVSYLQETKAEKDKAHQNK